MSQKPKGVAWLLKLFFLGQSTLESYHKMQIVRELLSASCRYIDMFLSKAGFQIVLLYLACK